MQLSSTPQVAIVRLITGEEVIGKMTQTPLGLQVVKPVLVAFQTPKPGETPSLAFLPYIPLAAEEKIEFNFSAVLFVYKPVVELENQYNSTFGGGIIKPPRPGLHIVQ
jgi:hypothetical protein